MTACQSDVRSSVRIATAEVPNALRECRTAPAKPKGNYKQKQVATYVTRLYYSYADCKAKLGQIDTLLTEQEALVTPVKP